MNYEIQGRPRVVVGTYLNLVVAMAVVGIYMDLVEVMALLVFLLLVAIVGGVLLAVVASEGQLLLTNRKDLFVSSVGPSPGGPGGRGPSLGPSLDGIGGGGPCLGPFLGGPGGGGPSPGPSLGGPGGGGPSSGPSCLGGPPSVPFKSI